MKIQVNIGDAKRSVAIRESAEAEVSRALERYADRITRVEVHLRDENSPSKEGPQDQRCSIEVRLAGLDPLAVDATAADLSHAIREAAGKAQRAVQRRLDRRDSHR